MNKNIIRVLAVVIIVVGVYLIANLQTPYKEMGKIGFSLPLSGPNASIGERVKKASLLAIDEYNSMHTGSQEISFVIEDDQSEAKIALSTFKKLVDIDQVSAVIGFVRSDQALAIAESANTGRVVALSPTAGADEITDAGDYIFRNIETGEAHGKGAVKFMQNKNINSVYILTGNASNAKTYSAHFKSNAEKEDIKVLGNSTYEPKQTDYRSQIVELISKKPEAVYIGVTTAPDAGLIVKQLRELRFGGVIMMSVAADGREFFDIVGSSAGESYVTASVVSTDKEGSDFKEKYKAKYDAEADGFSANGYDATKLIIQSIESCSSESNTALSLMRECIKTKLYSVKNYQGAGGNITFDSNGDVIKDVQVKKAGSRKFEIL